MTHSGDDLISKLETNVGLASADQAELAERMLESIGIRQLVRVEKRRRVYQPPQCRGVTVSIDIVAGVGTFVEAEVISADSIGAAELVEQVEKDLDVLGCPAVDLPYRDLAMGLSR